MKPLWKVLSAVVVPSAAILLTCLAAAAFEDDSPQPLLPILKTMPPINRPTPKPADPAPQSPAPQTEPADIPADHEAEDGEDRSARHIYRNVRQVRVPLDLRGATGLQPARHKAVVLYVSGNQGRTWVRTQKRSLPTTGLEFQAVNDGLYWCIFHGEPIETPGDAPPTGAPAEMIVTVDTTSPEVKHLAAEAIGEGEPLEVAWEVTDRSPLADLEIVAVQPQTNITFSPSQLDARKAGRARFTHMAAGNWSITAGFTDMAGNVATASCHVLVKAAPQVAETEPEEPADKLTAVAPLRPMPESVQTEPLGASPDPATEPDVDQKAQEAETPVAPALPGDTQLEPAGQVRARRQIAVLASRMLSIGYTWDTEHPPSRIGLWVTSDGGRTWKLDHLVERLTGTFVFQAPTDGVYGFLTHRELGPGSWGVPQSGMAPEREVIVDTVAPKVEWIGPVGVATADARGRMPAQVTGKAELQWLAVDQNLTEQPVRLDYRPFGKTRWQPLATDLAGAAAHEWSLPEDLAGDVEVRVTVADRAGHIAAADLRVTVVPPARPLDPGSDTAAQRASQEAIAEARRAYAMATLARLREDWTEAERQLKRATTLNPDHSRAWVDLGGIYVHNRRWDPAAAAYTKATELQPDNANALFGLARALAARGDDAGAMRTLESLLAGRPTDGDALVLYGDLLWKARRRDQARQSWLRALDAGGGSQAKLAAIQRRLQLKR